MTEEMKAKLEKSVEGFHLPRYEELPDVGLYLDQVVKYVNRYMYLAKDYELTPSMVSNYVKQKIVPGPIKKSYAPETIAYLIFVAYMKMILPMDMIRYMISVQQESYSIQTAYGYFCEEFENLLQLVFGLKDHPDEVGQDHTDQKELLHSALLSIIHKIYLESYLRFLQETLQ